MRPSNQCIKNKSNKSKEINVPKHCIKREQCTKVINVSKISVNVSKEINVPKYCIKRKQCIQKLVYLKTDISIHIIRLIAHCHFPNET